MNENSYVRIKDAIDKTRGKTEKMVEKLNSLKLSSHEKYWIASTFLIQLYNAGEKQYFKELHDWITVQKEETNKIKFDPKLILIGILVIAALLLFIFGFDMLI